MKYGIGDEAIIVKEKYGHQFRIGETVTIVDMTDVDYQAENAHGDRWWVRDEELEVEN
jgi:hypothetical protein